MAKPSRRKALARILIGLALLALSVTQALLVLNYIRAANTDQPQALLPIERHPVTKPAAALEERPDRVVLIVLDGLKEDTARQMPTLAALAGSWPMLKAQSLVPTLSRPSYAVMASGTGPWRTGIRTNGWPLPVSVDTIMDRARDGGLKVHGVGNLDFWAQNYKGAFASWHTATPWDNPAATDEAVLAALAAPSDLLVVHLVEMDRVGHESGAASEAYQSEALALDARLKKIFKAIDLRGQTLIVTSDHGHRDPGGHGGGEPEVTAVPLLIAGKGVKAGPANAEPVSLGAIAPTISMLLGLEFPRDLSFAPIDSILDPALFPQSHIDARREEWRAHRAAYEKRWLEVVFEAWTSKRLSGEVVGNRVSDATAVPEGASLEVLIEARDRTLEEIHRDRRVARTPLVALLIVPLMVLFVVGGLLGFGVKPVLALPVVGAAALGLHLAMGHPFSFTAIGTYEGIAVELGLCFAAGLGLYLALQAFLIKGNQNASRLDAGLFHVSYAALVHASVAPAWWLLSGFALDAPLPGAEMMFLPLFAGYIGGLFTGVAGVGWALSALRPAKKAA